MEMEAWCAYTKKVITVMDFSFAQDISGTIFSIPDWSNLIMASTSTVFCPCIV